MSWNINIEKTLVLKYYLPMSPKYDKNLDKYLREYQDNPRSRVFAPLAEAYRKSGLIDEAIDICKEGLEYHPNFISGMVALARAYFDKGLYSATIKELEKVVTDVPDNYLAQKLLAQSYSMIGDANNSLKSYKTVLFLNPHDEDAKKIIQEMEGKINKEPEYKEDEYEIPPMPTFEPPKFEHIEDELPEEQIKFEEKPLKEAFTTTQEPLTDEEKIIQELGTMTIAEILESQGQKNKAIEIYRKVLKEEPNNKELRARMERLEEELGIITTKNDDLDTLNSILKNLESYKKLHTR